MQKPLVIVVVLLCIALMGYFFIGTGEDPLPTVEEFSSAKIYKYYDKDLRKKFNFEIDNEDWKSIRAALLPAKRDPKPAKWVILASLDMTKQDGNRYYVGLYDTREENGAFAAGETHDKRVYYRGGITADLEKALKAAYEKSKKKKE